MNQKLRFLYHLLNLLPIKTKRIKRFMDLLRFYYRQNTLTIVSDTGIKTNPLKIPNYLHIRTYGNCRQNKIRIPEKQPINTRLALDFYGAHNTNLEIGNNNMIVMRAYIQGDNGRIKIGDNNHICDSVLYFYCSGDTTFSIGNGNLFSEQIVFWAGEGHSVISPITNNVTNIGGNITIGNDNWICMNVCFLKRAKIGDGCIVGYGSVLGGDFSNESKCVIAGNPATIVKRDILWSETEPWKYSGGIYRNK